MEDLLSQIKMSVSNKQYYVALFSSLAVPDICGALVSKAGKADAETYANWYDAWVLPNYRNAEARGIFKGSDCYRFRCEMLHQGYTPDRQVKQLKLRFGQPYDGSEIDLVRKDDEVLYINVRTLCLVIVKGARDWKEAASGSPTIQYNSRQFRIRYPDGLPPFIDSLPANELG